MGSIRVNSKGLLFFDFYYRKVRCREYTRLKDTVANRRRLERVLKKIERGIQEGSFKYADYFPNSRRARLFAESASATVANTPDAAAGEQKAPNPASTLPSFYTFSNQWFSEREVGWKRSQQNKVADILNIHLNPRFGDVPVDRILKEDVLAFRGYLARDYRNGKGLSPDRINQIINVLQQILTEAADRFEFTLKLDGIKPLRVGRTQVDPLSLDEVQRFLSLVPKRYRNFYTVAFFTGMRTSELIGLKRRYVDLERSEILIRETIVQGFEDTPKTGGSERVIQMTTLVANALREEMAHSDVDSAYVFHGRSGQPLNYRNMAQRVWYPTLKKAGLRPRRPYQTRHTAATLWLAAGENPEWIARQMGHTTTKMLFTVYSRYVPDLTRRDGSAMEQILNSRFNINTGGNNNACN